MSQKLPCWEVLPFYLKEQKWSSKFTHGGSCSATHFRKRAEGASYNSDRTSYVICRTQCKMKMGLLGQKKQDKKYVPFFCSFCLHLSWCFLPAVDGLSQAQGSSVPGVTTDCHRHSRPAKWHSTQSTGTQLTHPDLEPRIPRGQGRERSWGESWKWWTRTHAMQWESSKRQDHWHMRRWPRYFTCKTQIPGFSY